MHTLSLPHGEVLSRQPVFRRNPKTQRITLTGLILTQLDSLSFPVVVNRKGEWKAEKLTEESRKEYLYRGKRGLCPVPRGTMR